MLESERERLHGHPLLAERDRYKRERNELLSAYRVWKNATEERCRLLSKREALDAMLFPDRAFIEAVERISGTDKGREALG
jgi:hypothetical protein